jgi:hypothetical protein
MNAAKPSAPATPPPSRDADTPMSFAWVLCEELSEIRELRKKRQWDKELGDTAKDAPPPPPGPCAKKPSPSVVRCAKPDPDNPASYGNEVIRNAHEEKLVGLAFSGGGIRSATLNLGVLQGFANRGYLPMFDYLSTVSGGGYIGGWLEAWIARTAKDVREASCDDKAPVPSQTPIRKVQECLKTERVTKPGHLEPRPIRFLREYSNYLTPRLGLLGADTWTAVAIYLRNLILNQSILILFLASVLLIPYLATWIASVVVSLLDDVWNGFALPAVAFVLVLFAQIMVSRNMKFLAGERVGDSDETRYPACAQQGQILLLIAAPLVLAAWITSVWQWANGDRWPWWYWSLAGMVVFGLTWAIAALWNLPKTGPAAPPYGTARAWCISIGFSLVSGGVGGLLLWVLANEIYARWAGNAEFWNAVGFGTPLVIQVFLLVGTLQIGLMGVLFPDPRREWWGRLGGWMLIISLNWAIFFLAAAYAPLGLIWAEGWVKGLGVGWMATTMIGIWGGKSAASGRAGSGSWKELVLSATPYVFIAGLVAIIAWALELSLALLNKGALSAVDSAAISKFLGGSPVAEKVGGWVVSLDYTLGGGNGHALQKVTPTQPPAKSLEYMHAHWEILWAALNWKLGLVLAALLVVCLILARRVNLNEFSMNLFYRNRLVRAYLGASHTKRKPNPFTGLDPYDDILLRDFRHELCYSGPFPIVNTTLNLVSGKDLAWQERKAESFVMTPLRCGFDTRLEQIDLEQGSPAAMPDKISKYGYRPTERYLYNDCGPRMGTAVSISGAAASPNMGYHSIPSLAFLMTFFNVRLGFWAGNPRNDATWKDPGPKIGLFHLLAELFGQTDDEARYVYLSDGGHFENLGVYELVKRRCKFIIATDADADGSYMFENLGNAIRKCREDFGVEIEMNTNHLVPDPTTKLTDWHCAIGAIHYGQVDPGAEDGIFVYLKASLSGDEMADILNYYREHPDFPHQSTGDQWFSESQFEAYRRLGQHIVEWLLAPLGDEDTPPLPAHEFFQQIADKWPGTPPVPGETLLTQVRRALS